MKQLEGGGGTPPDSSLIFKSEKHPQVDIYALCVDILNRETHPSLEITDLTSPKNISAEFQLAQVAYHHLMDINHYNQQQNKGPRDYSPYTPDQAYHYKVTALLSLLKNLQDDYWRQQVRFAGMVNPNNPTQVLRVNNAKQLEVIPLDQVGEEPVVTFDQMIDAMLNYRTWLDEQIDRLKNNPALPSGQD